LADTIIDILKQYKKDYASEAVLIAIKELELENHSVELELKEELIKAYQDRGNMYMAGEKEYIQNRIKELKG
jgi:hypothetical protein